MSLISDALKKAQLQRAAPSASWAQAQPAYARAPHATPSSSRRLIVANIVVLTAICVGAFYFFGERATPARAIQPSPVATVPPAEPAPASASASSSDTGTAKLAASPFLANDAAPSAPHNVSPDYNLAGISSLGNNTLLSVVRQSDKRSVWVPVGKTVSEITAVSYDPESDQAVIRVHGHLLSIAMHDAGAPSDAAPKAAE